MHAPARRRSSSTTVVSGPHVSARRWSRSSPANGRALSEPTMPELTNRILIIDFGSQYTQLIARRVREAHVYCEIHPPTRTVEWIREWAPRGIILSGGPNSVYGEGVPTADPDLLE